MALPVVILLAAGRGERFLASGATAHKLDALLCGQPLIWHVIEAIKAAGLDWYLVRPTGGTGGMGESIAMGVKATAQAPGWLILPADLPLILPDSLQRVAAGLKEKPVVVPFYRKRLGHPVGFARDYFPSLTALSGESGARDIVRHAQRQGSVMTLALSDVGIARDIDTLADLHLAQRILQRRKRTSPEDRSTRAHLNVSK